MCRLFSIVGLGLLLVGLTMSQSVAEPGTADCLREGDPIGVFHVTKVAGALDDGVEPGEELCYRCRYGSSPMVMVFVRDTGGKVMDLAKAVEQAVVEHEEARLKGIITLLGDDSAALMDEAAKFASAAGVKTVPVVVAKETKTGPLSYRLPEDVDITIVLAKDSQVVATHLFTVDNVDIAAILGEAKQMLN